MKLIGLTGGIASGKSTACDYIKHHSTIPIIDADEMAHRLFHQYNVRIAAMFPELSKRGRVEKEDLAELVFGDREKRRKLEHFLHPLIRRGIILKLLYYWSSGHRVIILDIPLLFELGLDHLMSEVILIYCSPTIQRHRLKHRDGFTMEQTSARLHSQIQLAEKTYLSDTIIDNNGSLPELYNQLDVFIDDTKRTVFILDAVLFYITPIVFLILIVLNIATSIASVL